MTLISTLVLFLAAAACGTARADDAPGTADPSSYRIGPEDVLRIDVWNNEPLSRTVPVRPDGNISLPLLNDIHAAGLTPTGLRQTLMERLEEYMPTPEVSVTVTEVKSFKVSVIGAVAKPGRFELKSWATVMDVLAMAEGFTEFASRSRVVVLRSNGGTLSRLPFDYEKVRSGDGRQPNFEVRPGDIVLVP